MSQNEAVNQTPTLIPFEALRTSEVLKTIFEFSSRPTLAAAAIVCSAWKEPALEVLWRHLPSMLPLLELMVPLGYTGGIGWDFEDPRNSQVKDAATLAVRMRGVQTLRHNERDVYRSDAPDTPPDPNTTGDPDATEGPNTTGGPNATAGPNTAGGPNVAGDPNAAGEPNTIEAPKITGGPDSVISDRLALRFRCLFPLGSFLFPALKSLVWEPKWDNITLFMAISSPVLKDVSITLSWLSSASLPSILKSLATRLPEDLDTLRLEWSGSMSDGDKSSALLELFKSQRRVRSLWLRGGSDLGVKHIESLRTLCHLEELSLSVRLEAVDQAPQTLLHVASHCPQLTVFRAFLVQPPRNLKQVRFVAISPLLSLNHLVHLEIHGPPIQMQREDIINMGKSWPYLNTLSIEGASDFTSEPSLSQLPVFAEAFSQTLLALELNLSCDYVPSEATLSGFYFHNLQYLAVGTQRLPTGRSVAISRILAKICPKAKIVPSLASNQFPEKSDWITVATLVEAFQGLNG